MMVRCKYFVIDIMLEEEKSRGTTNPQELQRYKAKLEKTIGYGDLGQIALGKWCAYLIDFAVFFTQFLTCVAYFIFLANTIYTIFPLEPAAIPLNQSYPVENQDLLQSYPCVVSNTSSGLYLEPPVIVNGIPMLNIPQTSNDPVCRNPQSVPPILNFDSKDNVPESDLEILSSIGKDIDSSQIENDNKNGTNTTVAPTTTTAPPKPPKVFWKSISPKMQLLFFIPLPFFILTSMIRSLRVLSPFTILATVALFAGAIAVLSFICSGEY